MGNDSQLKDLATFERPSKRLASNDARKSSSRENWIELYTRFRDLSIENLNPNRKINTNFRFLVAIEIFL